MEFVITFQMVVAGIFVVLSIYILLDRICRCIEQCVSARAIGKMLSELESKNPNSSTTELIKTLTALTKKS